MTNFYQNRNILVTGGTGFLGSHFVDELSRHDCDIVVPSGIDLTDRQQSIKLFFQEGPFDMVFHLAAKCNGIKDNVKNGISYFTTNTAIDLNVIECCHKFNVGKVVTVGSVCMYADLDEGILPINETALTVGYPSDANYHYGMAKRNLGILMDSYEFPEGSVFPILSNLYGPGDYFFEENAHVIPSIITKFYSHKNPELWGDGTPTRDFLYVRDAAKILIMAGEHIKDSKPFNVSPSLPTPVSAVADLIAKRMGVNSYTWDSTKPNGTMHRHYSNERMKRLLGDFEFTVLDRGLDLTLEYFEYQLDLMGMESIEEKIKSHKGK